MVLSLEHIMIWNRDSGDHMERASRRNNHFVLDVKEGRLICGLTQALILLENLHLVAQFAIHVLSSVSLLEVHDQHYLVLMSI
jgi:hypothetical protein